MQQNYGRVLLFDRIGSLAVQTRSHVSSKPTSKALSHQIELQVKKDKGWREQGGEIVQSISYLVDLTATETHWQAGLHFVL